MNYKVTHKAMDSEAVPFPANKLKMGEIGKVTSGIWIGKYLLRTYSEIVCLNEPHTTWMTTGCIEPVVLLRKGEELLLAGTGNTPKLSVAE